MEYKAPFGAGDPDDPYVDFNDVTGEAGSIPPAAGVEHPQREIVNVIEACGLTPSAADLTQLEQAIAAMIAAAAPTIDGDSVVIAAENFEGGVADGNPVYWHAANGEWTKSVADDSAANRAVGIADVTGGSVTIYGVHTAGIAGLTPGARQYLSDTAGTLAETPAADVVQIGIARAADELFVDVDAQGGGAKLRRITRFTDSGTYNKPGWLKFAVVKVQGSGGGGGYAAASGGQSSYGGGGGGGGFAEVMLTAADLGASETVTVGAAGTGGVGGTATNATVGGTVSFGSLVSCTGGNQGGQSTSGTSAANSPGKPGGSPTISTGAEIIQCDGGGSDGGWRIDADSQQGGVGGQSVLGMPGRCTATNTGNDGVSGHDATGHGAGGSGAAAYDGASADGGAGSKGIVIVMEYA